MADAAWFTSQIPSVQASQDRLDELATSNNTAGSADDSNVPTIDLSHVTVSRGATSINASSAAIQNLIGGTDSVAISIDAESKLLKNSHGFIIGPDKMAIIIVAYREPGVPRTGL